MPEQENDSHSSPQIIFLRMGTDGNGGFKTNTED